MELFPIILVISVFFIPVTVVGLVSYKRRSYKRSHHQFDSLGLRWSLILFIWPAYFVVTAMLIIHYFTLDTFAPRLTIILLSLLVTFYANQMMNLDHMLSQWKSLFKTGRMFHTAEGWPDYISMAVMLTFLGLSFLFLLFFYVIGFVVLNRLGIFKI